MTSLGDGLLASHHPFRPLYAQETLWSGNQHGHPDYSDDELRKNAYVILFSGAALNFSDNGGPRVEDIGNSSSGFSGTLELDDRRQWRHDIVKRVWDFVETIPDWWTMRPRQDLVRAGRCLACEGERYLMGTFRDVTERKLMEAAGVPVVPGTTEPIDSADEALEIMARAAAAP